MPIRPAIRPAFSWSWPSDGETVTTSLLSKLSGSAPKFRTLARSWASLWLNLPEMTAEPPGIDSLTSGWETTAPSRTTAN